MPAAILRGGSQDGVSVVVDAGPPAAVLSPLARRLVDRAATGPKILADISEVYRLSNAAEPYAYAYTGTAPTFLLGVTAAPPAGVGQAQDEGSGPVQDEGSGPVSVESGTAGLLPLADEASGPLLDEASAQVSEESG